jgi:hypothetical protein
MSMIARRRLYFRERPGICNRSKRIPGIIFKKTVFASRLHPCFSGKQAWTPCLKGQNNEKDDGSVTVSGERAGGRRRGRMK